MRILLAVPHGAKPIEDEALEALWQLDRCGHEVVFRVFGGYDCARARNAIAQAAIDLLCDKCMMVDSDVVVPSDAIARLTDGDAPIVLGCYQRKDGSGRTEMFTAQPGTGHVPWDKLPNGRFDVHGGGFGCAMMDVSVFREMRRPWFSYPEFEDGGFISEDLGFCADALGAGFRIEGDGRVRCKHIGKQVFG